MPPHYFNKSITDNFLGRTFIRRLNSKVNKSCVHFASIVQLLKVHEISQGEHSEHTHTGGQSKTFSGSTKRSFQLHRNPKILLQPKLYLEICT